MRRKPKGPSKAPPPGTWKYRVGDAPVQLTAFERPEKGNAIYTRIWNGRKYSRKRPLFRSIRDAAGKVVPELEVEAQRLAIARHKETLANLPDEETGAGPLTVGAGFRRLLHPKSGKYPTDTPHRREVKRAAILIQDVLGADREFDTIRHRDYRAVWRHIAHEHKKNAGRLGYRTAEIVCGVLQSAARWLQREGYLEPGDALPAPGWKQEMRQEWEQITDAPVRAPEVPRYTDAESDRLWLALPRADPRVALAFEIGAELRLGQVARLRRTDIQPHGGFAIGKVIVHGRGKKLGETIILTMEQRHAIARALLWGYLAYPEAAYRAGELEDYFLIAGGRLHGAEDHRGRKVKRVRVEGAARNLTRRALGRQWEELEMLAKVDHVDGRLWYGMRRLQADRAEGLTGVEARVKNRMGGWSKTSTREGYLEKANLRDAEAAAAARRKIRPGKEKQGGKLPPKVTPAPKKGVTQ